MGRTITGTVDISLNPTSVIRGEWARVAAVVRNTGAAKARIDLRFSAVSDCDSTRYELGYNSLRLNGGQEALVTTAFPTPPAGCAGEYTVTATIEAGNRELDSDSDALTVTES